jgi:transposase
MRYIKKLTEKEIESLSELVKNSKNNYQEKIRANCILLSNKDYSISELSDIFNSKNRSIYNWFNSWEEEGINGLYDKKGRGRKKIYSKEEEVIIIKLIENNPRDIKQVLIEINDKLNKTSSKDTIKRILSDNDFIWKRVKRIPKGEPDKEIYKKKTKELEILKKRDKNKEIKLWYLDESGFSLTSYVPYAWQRIGTEIEVLSSRSKRINVVGFINRDNEIISNIFECNVNKEIILSCIDDFSNQITGKNVIVMDNASVHNISDKKKLELIQKGVEIFELPTYSPQLNIAEILWRFIKYRWLEFTAYRSFKTLKEALEKILSKVGDEYTIKFA